VQGSRQAPRATARDALVLVEDPEVLPLGIVLVHTLLEVGDAVGEYSAAARSTAAHSSSQASLSSSVMSQSSGRKTA
jgi:hypothetical protein